MLGFEVLEVDNTSVQPGDDPMEPEFAGGVTHFTFDLRVIVNAENDWTAAETDLVLKDLRVRIFYHSYGDRTPGRADFVEEFPAVEFDTLLANTEADGDHAPPIADPDGIIQMIDDAMDFAPDAWFAVPPNGGEGEFTMARLTFVVQAGCPIVPGIVARGDGGGAPLVGVLDGTGMSMQTWGDCNNYAFDVIVGHCRGDVDGDYDIDQSDLGILLADWGCSGGGCPGDCDNDGDTDQSDLGILLSYWGAGCS